MPSTNRLFKQVPQAWSFGRVNREILFEACGDFLQTPLDVAIKRLHDLGDLFALHRLLARVEVCPDGGAGFGFVELHFKGHARAERTAGNFFEMVQPSAEDEIASGVAVQRLDGAVATRGA